MSTWLNPRRNDHEDEIVIARDVGTDLIMRAATLATEKDQQAVILLINALQVDLRHMLRELQEN